MPQPMNGGTVGIIVSDLVVAEITDSRATEFGWAVGDRILQVNGFPVMSMQEYNHQVSRAISSYQAVSRPLVFDVWRAPVTVPTHGLGVPMLSSGALHHASPAPMGSGLNPEITTSANHHRRSSTSRRRTICGEGPETTPPLTTTSPSLTTIPNSRWSYGHAAGTMGMPMTSQTMPLGHPGIGLPTTAQGGLPYPSHTGLSASYPGACGMGMSAAGMPYPAMGMTMPLGGRTGQPLPRRRRAC